jgi:hypothetical protein
MFKSCDINILSLSSEGWGSGALGCLRKSDIFFLKQVIQHHDFFLDKCLRECLLLLPELLKVSFSLLCFVFYKILYILFYFFDILYILFKSFMSCVLGTQKHHLVPNEIYK